MASIRMSILDCLDNLSSEDLDKFCHQLIHRGGDPRVRRNKVEGKSRLQITDVLVNTFTEPGALDVTVELLEKIGCQQDAKDLEKDTRNLTKRKKESKDSGASGTAASGDDLESDAEDELDSSEDPAVSFIRGKKVKLITCLGADLFILEFAQQERVILDSEYREIKSITSKDAAVTKLINVVMDKGAVCCRPFLKILKENKVVEKYPELKRIMKDWK